MFLHNVTADVKLDKISEEGTERKGADGSELIFEDLAVSWDRRSPGGSSCHRRRSYAAISPNTRMKRVLRKKGGSKHFQKLLREWEWNLVS